MYCFFFLTSGSSNFLILQQLSFTNALTRILTACSLTETFATKCFTGFPSITELNRSKTKPTKLLFAPSEASDQPGHPSSLIWVFTVRTKKPSVLSFPLSASEDSDQTGRTPRVIWVFAGRTDHFVGFVMLRLNYSWAIVIGNSVPWHPTLDSSRSMTKPIKWPLRPAKTDQPDQSSLCAVMIAYRP